MRASPLFSTVAAAVVLAGPAARAQDAPAPPMGLLVQRPDVDSDEGTLEARGYFNGLASPNRPWEVQSETAFSTSRVFTQRFEVARLIALNPRNASTALVLRTDFGVESDTTTGFYSLQGPLFSLGGRLRSTNNDHSIEAGVRLIPPYPGANDTNPLQQRLALGATLASGQADDARWLTFNRFGYQIYAIVQSRVPVDTGAGRLFFGVRYGGQTSLTPLSIPTWLGTEEGIVANVFLDLYVAAPSLCGNPLGLKLGVHGEASLSSIWPASDVLPLMGAAFVAWSPATWIATRVFYGVTATPAGGLPASYPYGLSLAFYL